MNTCLVTIEAEHNNRVQAGLNAVEHLWTLEEGYAVYPCGGHCLPSDIYTTYLEN